MSDSEIRTQVKLIVTDLQTNISQLATSANNAPVVQYSRPPVYASDGPHLAVWYESEEVARTNPTGSRLFAETYQVRYWEPDINRDVYLTVDEDAQNDLQNLYRACLNRFMVGTNWYPVGTSSNVMAVIPVRSAITPEAERLEDGAFIRGFGIEVQVQRWRSLT